MDTPTNTSSIQELDRLAAVEEYERLSIDERDALDDIANLASRICKVPISLVTFITDNEQLIRGSEGLDVEKTSREVAFCAHTIENSQLFQVEDAWEDERFQNNPLVTGSPNIRFYAGMPLKTSDGKRLGALCVIDREPRHLTDEQEEALRVLSDQVIKRLELSKVNRELNKSYSELAKVNAMRTKLINVLAHDIRAPMASMRMVVDLIAEGELSEAERHEFSESLSVVMSQADDMLENILNWGKSLGEESHRTIVKVNLFDIVDDVRELTSMQARLKGLNVEVECNRDTEVYIDPNVFRLVLRNLLSNALKYSPVGETISIQAELEDETVTLRVSDHGEGMSEDKMQSLMKLGAVYQSAKGTSGEKGTGVGLMFVIDVLSRSGGELSVNRNSSGGSTFVAKFPVPFPNDEN